MRTIKKELVCALFFLMVIGITPAYADNFLRVYSTYANTEDTVGMSEQFLAYGITIPVFLPPYTLQFTVNPVTDSTYKATVDCYELAPGYKDYHFDRNVTLEDWQKIDGLEAKGLKFDYHFVIFTDTVSYFDYLAADSMINNESIHFRSRILRYSYADYKWEMRKGYLENIFNNYRKDHMVTRGGKIDLYVYNGSNNSPFINNFTGVGYDFTKGAMYTVFNQTYDSVLPQYTQLFVIYETWGYGPRSLAVGYSRYFLDDIYRARGVLKGVTTKQVKAILTDEYPSDKEIADIVSGAFVRYLADHYGVPLLKKLYTESRPNDFAFKNTYKKSFDEIIADFIKYEQGLQLTEPDAYYYANVYAGQMWFEQALEYYDWLGKQPINRDYHLKELGAEYFYAGNYDKSKEVYAALLERNQDMAEPRYLVGMALLRLGKDKQAIRYLEEASDSIENAAKILAEIYLDAGNIDNAEKALEKVPEYPDSWTSLLKARVATIHGNDNIATALINKTLSQGQQLVSMVPGEARGYISTAYAFMMGGKYTEAESELHIALFVDNRDYYKGTAYLALGRLYDLQEQRDKAKDFYNQVIKTNSDGYTKELAKKYIEKPFELR